MDYADLANNHCSDGGGTFMKYIYYIAAMVVIALALFIFQFFAGQPETQRNPAIIINDRVITVEDLAKMKPPHDESRQEFINSLITKELLIQEAQRTGIDREEAFRRSIQTFYEQSLVKSLVDRKFSSLNIKVSEEEIDKYSSMLDKKVEITVFRGKSADDLNAGRAKEEKIRIAFGDLSRNMRGAVASLRIGEKSAPFTSGMEYISITLDNVQPGGSKLEMKRDDLKKLITEEKREQMIAEWLDGLRKKATIKVTESAANGG
jgi:hypothetical protein